MNTQEQFHIISDGLANSGFARVDNFLSTAELSSLLKSEYFRESLSQMRSAGIGKEGKTAVSVRGDQIYWIDRAEAPECVQLYFARLFELMTYLNRDLFLSLKDIEAHLTRYPPGTFYKRHLDQFRRDDHRRLSVILYLNKEWKPEEGGVLRLYVNNHPIDILPNAGRLVLFRSDLLEHEVLPASRDRLSITGWMLDR